MLTKKENNTLSFKKQAFPSFFLFGLKSFQKGSRICVVCCGKLQNWPPGKTKAAEQSVPMDTLLGGSFFGGAGPLLYCLISSVSMINFTLPVFPSARPPKLA